MNCVQCGEALPESAKFCKKCGCKTGEPAQNGGQILPPVPAYTTCPDCGALCKADARFCVKCACRFEDNPTFEDTCPVVDTQTPEEEQAVLVFGNVQDSSEPSSANKTEKIHTGAAMLIGDGAPPLVVAAAGTRASDMPGANRQPASAPTGLAVKPVVSPRHTPGHTTKHSKQPAREPHNPRPEPATSVGAGKWAAVVVLALALLVGGGVWWGSQAKTAPRPAAPVRALAPPVTPLPTQSSLTSDESLDNAAAIDAATNAQTAALDETQADASATAEAQKPAVNRPARKQSLDDLLN